LLYIEQVAFDATNPGEAPGPLSARWLDEPLAERVQW
jgi:hypothetical protein